MTNTRLSKRAYGGDLQGDEVTYYDRTWIPPYQQLQRDARSKERQAQTTQAMRQYANYVKRIYQGTSQDGYQDKPFVAAWLSTDKYNQGDIISGQEWANAALQAYKNKNLDKLRQLNRYGYAYYTTDKNRVPQTVQEDAADQVLRTTQRIGNIFICAALATLIGGGLFAGGYGAYRLAKGL